MAQMEYVFKEYEARRKGIIEALTSDLDELLKESKDVQMNTPFLERKCLWGLPDGSWKVEHAEYQAAGQIPQPQPLIAFGKQWDEWVSRMADLSDAWLISLADYQSRHLSLNERKLLVEKISRMPSLKSVITPECPLALLDINEVPLKFHPEYLGKKSAPTFCMRRKCNFVGDDSGIEEWIECNMCELWYHCNCCDLASEKVETIQFYNCANCLAKEVTYIMIKPDGIRRGLVGKIISCFEKKGFFLKGLKLFQCPKELAQEHYRDLKDRAFFPNLIGYITSGPVVCMAWEGAGVVASARKLIGATNPLQADPGTIRGDLTVQIGRNVVGGSDSRDNGKREVDLWFKQGELAQ